MDTWIKEAIVILSRERDALLSELNGGCVKVKPVLLDQSTQGRLNSCRRHAPTGYGHRVS
jgi:hypothetical protein